MVLLDFAAHAESVAGKLAAVSDQIVAAGEFTGNAQGAHGVENQAELPVLIIAIDPGDKGKIEVAPVVIHRTAAGDAAHELHLIALHGIQIAFSPRVLIAADDNGVFVDIKIQRQIVRANVLQDHRPCQGLSSRRRWLKHTNSFSSSCFPYLAMRTSIFLLLRNSTSFPGIAAWVTHTLTSSRGRKLLNAVL